MTTSGRCIARCVSENTPSGFQVPLTTWHKQDSEYHFVAFNGQLSSVKEHHGKVLTTVDMRDEDPPDPVLCASHFEQAVMRFVRAYSVRMAINAQ